MTELSNARPTGLGFLRKLRELRLAFACVAIVLCFVLVGDMYGATKAERRARQLAANGIKRERVVDYSQALRQTQLNRALLGASKREYIVDPKRKQANMMEVLTGSLLCAPPNASFPTPLINVLPYEAFGTTQSGGDDYNIADGLIEDDEGACPTPTCEATNDSEGFNDRGYAYLGTGYGDDVAYRINIGVETNLRILLEPQETGNDADDLALLVYYRQCTNNHSDVVVMADNRYPDPQNPDPNGNDEEITITKLPRGYYNIVVDAYSYLDLSQQNPPNVVTAGPYKLTVECATPGCAQPLGPRVRRSIF